MLSIVRSTFWIVALACLALACGASSATAAKLKILDASATESASALKFSVRLIGNTERPVRVSYGTVSGSAVAGSDFSTAIGQLAFQPETTKRSIVVRIVHDSVPEGKETFGIKLWKPIGATIARGRATGTIRDDDGPRPMDQGIGIARQGAPGLPKVVIDEILPDPKGTEADYEYVELLNTETSSVDLTGWTIDSGAECPLSGVLAPGGLYVVSNDALIQDSPCALALPNVGGTLTLRDGPSGSGAATVDAVDYTGFPIIPGVSISLDPTDADPARNDLAVSWCAASLAGATAYGASENIGTPGALNGPCQN